MPNNVLSDDQIVSELTALGCPFTADLLQKFVTALAVRSSQGTVARGVEVGANGAEVNQVDKISKQPFLKDNPYDEGEAARKRKLASAITRKLNLASGANKFVAYDGPPANPPAAAPVPAAPVPSAAPTAAAPVQPVAASAAAPVAAPPK